MSRFLCEPTPVFHGMPPHSRQGSIVWMPTIPSGNGIIAAYFVTRPLGRRVSTGEHAGLAVFRAVLPG